jgi:hypothetical protein
MPAVRTSRATAGLLAAALVAAGGAATVQARSAAVAAEEAERRTAQHELDREVFALRTGLAEPAHTAERSAADLLVTVVETVTGSERDAGSVRETLDALVDDLRTAADQLDETAAQPLPARPETVPVQTAEAVFARLELLEDRAGDVAAQLREAADHAEVFASASHELSTAAAEYAASTDELPDSDDPEVLATAWRAERDRLATYREAVDVAVETEGLEELAGTHAELVNALQALADDAVEALDAGDVDGYNDRLADVLGDRDTDTLGEDLVAATEAALDAATLSELQQARTAALELLIDLEDLRRVTGPAAG